MVGKRGQRDTDYPSATLWEDTEYEYDSVESMQENFGTSYLYTTLLREKVKDFLYDSAKVTELPEDEYYQDMEDEEYYYEDTEAVG